MCDMRWKTYTDWKTSKSKMFDKKRNLKDTNDEETLPNISEIFQHPLWKIETLEILKARLNKEKDKLNNYSLSDWNKHTKVMNPSKFFLRLIRNHYGAEFTSKAWGKMYELMSTELIIPALIDRAYYSPHTLPFNSVHLCEAPGGFIAGINHYISTHYMGLEWNWIATSLNPYHEGNSISRAIHDDDFIRSRLQNWTFLEDNTGDILKPGNIKYLALSVEDKFGSADLVTADGSFDCQMSPNEQEVAVMELLYAEITTALQVLGKDGTFILKIFTVFECQTICYLYLLSCLFDEVKLVKPVLSTEGNSEVYVICLRYHGATKDLIETLLLTPGTTSSLVHDAAMFPLKNIPVHFLEKVKAASQFFTETQISVISRNIATLDDNTIIQKLERPAMEFANCCIKRFGILLLQPHMRINKNYNYDAQSSRLEFKFRVDAREDYTELCLEQIDQAVKYRIELLAKNFKSRSLGFTFKEIYQTLKCVHGKMYTEILSSPFCNGKLLHLRQQLRELVSNYWIPSSFAPTTQHCNDSTNTVKLRHMVAKFGGEETEFAVNTLCFHESLESFVIHSDATVTLSALKSLMTLVKYAQKNASFFLCEFPMLSRLHVGYVFLLTNFFEKISFGFNTDKQIHGVLLYKFEGLQNQRNLFEDMNKFVETSEAIFPAQGLLEILPIEEIIKCNGYEAIVVYNMANLYRGIQDHANATALHFFKFKNQDRVK